MIYNVLSNAFKFTPDHGFIEVSVTTDYFYDNDGTMKNYAKISVSDTGYGIAEEKLDKIFDRFYQIDNQQGVNSGTGIGLHLSRSLIELQNGKIYAENRKDRSGSIFHILIPLGKDHVSDPEARNNLSVMDQSAGEIKMFEYIKPPFYSEINAGSELKTKKKPRYSILIADDDSQMLEYLMEELKNHYSVIICNNGKDALEGIHQYKPDLVISDIMMPVMDGITLCKKLKSNPSTTHLPILLLTARSRDEDRVEGLVMGADAYLVKPFSADLLRKNIDNLLSNRERIKIKYSSGGNISASGSNFSSADKKLMEKIMLIIEGRIADPKLNAEELSREVGMSRVHLFRRMKKITGQPPSDFIRKIRLQKAAQLLEGNAGFIKEIAYETGFASLSHFSRCFHDFYGMKPSDYARRENISSFSEH